MQSFFGNNRRESPKPVKAQIRGEIPKWLQGTLIRNGPGMHKIGDTVYNHWFDGMALLHSFTFKDGEIFYRSKYLRSDTYRSNMEANRIVVSEFGTMAYPDPCKNIFAKAFSYLSHTIPDFTDNCLINIIRCGEDLYASTETNYIRKIDLETLETNEKVDYRKYVALNLATSHPHYDTNGNTYNMGTSIGDKGKTKYQIIKIPQSKPGDKEHACFTNCEVICSIPSRSLLRPSYFHSFGMTENYIVFIEQPFKLDILKLATAYFRGVNWASCLGWYPNDKLDDAAFEKQGKTFSSPSCRRFVIPLQHDKNVELGTNIVTLENTTASALKEKDGYVYCKPEILFEGIELPRINYDYNGKKYRYIYASKVQWRPVPTKIIKCDILTKTCYEWREDHCWPAEPVFVRAPEAKEEDDGVLLSSIVSSDPKTSSFLLVLDAKTFKELGRASVTADIHLDLHGLFIPEK
ncbi:beta,beta-carotene 15,15'-dioxygenase isoform X2 [Callorhinchus milii]|uniref:beta,beta-carotene 15,15'-dioxygenase isoform X2 n=1 Tax=Callorhinchus milii TaxID=7868 RepID=UPI000457508D|nr:beta,beta-carotene 15,15'-dioxygenase isoform X2 [Callorhinchus milii]|eukprot:gi/632944357/ref/XP_007887465.1/ PREDICTED: beta,beta-carotene 15,15'-monooxygenase isoform X2 [Callorhinchus milii]